MPAYLTDPANKNYDFGKNFNYAVWPENSVVTLTNVPWNNDYRDVCQFPNASGQSLDQYIDSNILTNDTISNISYIKFNVPIRLNIPFNSAFMFNYLRVQNQIEPIPGTDKLKSYYYFILDVKYIAPNTTEFTIQLDIFQSFKNDFSFGNSYVERGHIGIANQNAFNNYGRDYLTSPEGMDIGGEYQIIAKRSQRVIKPQNPTPEGGSWTGTDDHNILVVSSVDLTAAYGTVTSPILVAAKGSSFASMPSGAGLYGFQTLSSFLNFMQSISNAPWVGQGIMSITMIPPLNRYFSVTTWAPSGTPTAINDSSFIFDGTNFGNKRPATKIYDMFSSWRNAVEITNKIPTRYSILKKFFTAPYMIIEATTWSGNPIIIKPESWANDHATIAERANIIPPDQRIIFMPKNYNSYRNSVTDPDGDDNAEFLDMAVTISNFPTVPIINNGAIAYLAANKNGIAFQRQSADWSQQRATMGLNTSYDQATSGITTNAQLTDIATRANSAQNDLQNITEFQQMGLRGAEAIGGGAFKGGIRNSGMGAAGGAIMGAAESMSMTAHQAITNNARSLSTGIKNSAMQGATSASNSNLGYMRDTNRNLATFAAKGDYANSIAGINAKVRDAMLTQPSVAGQYGGDAANIAYYNSELSIRWKLIDGASIRRIGEYWLRYGYSVMQFSHIPVNLMVMTKFTYWKLQETYITSAKMPESFKQIIRGIFEKGVTVWADPSYIGNIDIADNQPLAGIVL